MPLYHAGMVVFLALSPHDSNADLEDQNLSCCQLHQGRMLAPDAQISPGVRGREVTDGTRIRAKRITTSRAATTLRPQLLARRPCSPGRTRTPTHRIRACCASNYTTGEWCPFRLWARVRVPVRHLAWTPGRVERNRTSLVCIPNAVPNHPAPTRWSKGRDATPGPVAPMATVRFTPPRDSDVSEPKSTRHSRAGGI